MAAMLPFALSSDDTSVDLPLVRPANEVARQLRIMVKPLCQPAAGDSEAQRERFTLDILAAFACYRCCGRAFDVATELCPCPDVDPAIALLRSWSVRPMQRWTLHAEAVFLDENLSAGRCTPAAHMQNRCRFGTSYDICPTHFLARVGIDRDEEPRRLPR